MQLVSRKILDQFESFTNYAFYFRTVPFKWDSKTEKLCLRFRETTWTLRNWKLVSTLYFIHQVFIMFRFYQYVLDSRSVQNIPEAVFQFINVAGYSMVCAVQVAFIFKRNSIVMFVNSYIDYFKKLQGKICLS